MADKKNKAALLEQIDSEHDFGDAEMDSSRNVQRRRLDAKQIRRISPIGMRVLVAIKKDSNQTDAGLYLPEGAKQATQDSLLAEVLEVASASESGSDEEANISGIPLGALVLIPKSAGIKTPWDDDKRIVDTKDILAIVHEVSVV